jgi:hypothetical protein
MMFLFLILGYFVMGVYALLIIALPFAICAIMDQERRASQDGRIVASGNT